MKEFIVLHKEERNTETINGIVIAEFVEHDNNGNRYQILHAINPETNYAKLRINNLSRHETIYDGFVVDVQSEDTVSDKSGISYEVTYIFAIDSDNDVVFVVIVAVPWYATHEGGFELPDYDNAMLGFTEVCAIDEYEEVI